MALVSCMLTCVLKTQSNACSELLLTPFDPKILFILSANASNYGVVAIIPHILSNGSEKGIANESRTLTLAENNFSQIEKEPLAIIYVVKKVHKFVYGRRFTFLTNRPRKKESEVHPSYIPNASRAFAAIGEPQGQVIRRGMLRKFNLP